MECGIKDCLRNKIITEEGSRIKFICELDRDPQNCYHYKFITRVIDNGTKEREGAGEHGGDF